MSLGEIQRELAAEWKLLCAAWEEATSRWDDGARDEFERLFWDECHRVVPGFLEALEELGEALSRALEAASEEGRE